MEFNNNFKFHHKNSASPSICLMAKTILPLMPNTPQISNILNTLNYKQDDFKYFFKIWPNINDTIVCDYDNNVNNLWLPIRDMWIKNWSLECRALEYERDVYRRLDSVVRDNNYTLTPILSDSENSTIDGLAHLLNNFKTTDPNYRLFAYMFFKWLVNPQEPNKLFDYNKAILESNNLSAATAGLIKFIYNNLTFSCIMTPVIMGDNVTTFDRFISNTKDNITNGTSIDVVMRNFCDVFSNVVKGIKNLKEKNIAHNDLHSGNIFVQRFPDDTYNTFIYDYDRSYSPALNNNPLLNNNICRRLCQSGQCNKYDNWLDFFKILYYILLDTPLNFKLLLLEIITDSPNNPDFVPFIQIMARNAFFISTVSNCCWYWDSNSKSHKYKNKIQTLLVDYYTVIERIRRYNTTSFAFAPPQSDKYVNNKYVNNKLFKNDTNYVNKIENTKGKSSVFDKMSSDKLSINKLSINKLSIDLITGKYVDLSVKRTQRPSTAIDTIEKFEDVIEKNNEEKAMLRKNNK